MAAEAQTLPQGVSITGASIPRGEDVLTQEAIAFLVELHRRFDPERQSLLRARVERQRWLDAGVAPRFLPETASVRESVWHAAPPPGDLAQRKVEITGPVERKLMINALNSGADVFMADLEDSNTPTWHNVVTGQANLQDALLREITLDDGGRQYRLNEQVAVLFVRPRGWHLPEKHFVIDGQPISGSLFDFGLYVFHHTRLRPNLPANAPGPYYYLPKLESYLEARLWNQVFEFSEDALGLDRGTIRATVLIETILAAFEMEEILYELRDHSAGLNAGRWDYIFSAIKKLHAQKAEPLPDRTQITMTSPFMRAYTELLLRTCHRRGVHAIGGMAAFIPNRRDPEANEIAMAKVREDKVREVHDGFDGTWVAHPDLVPVARAVFDAALGDRRNQVDRAREDVAVTGEQLLDLHIPGGAVTRAGLERNISVGIQYLASWLRGNGAVALYNLMEDAATAEISRSQVWQWVRTAAELEDGTIVTAEMTREIIRAELARLREQAGDAAFAAGHYEEAAEIFEEVALGERFVDFLTIPAYERLA